MKDVAEAEEAWSGWVRQARRLAGRPAGACALQGGWSADSGLGVTDVEVMGELKAASRT